MDEEKRIKATYTFYLPEHQRELKMVQVGNDMYDALYEIKQLCRNASKHGDNEDVAEFADEVNKIIWEVPIDDL